MLEKMYNLAKKNNSDLVICDQYEITENNKVVKKAIKHMSEDIKINYMFVNGYNYE